MKSSNTSAAHSSCFCSRNVPTSFHESVPVGLCRRGAHARPLPTLYKRWGRARAGPSATLQHTSSSSSARRYGFACSVRPDDGSPRRAFRQSTCTHAGGETTDDSSVRPLRPHAQTWASQRARAGGLPGGLAGQGEAGARTYQLGKELHTGRHRHHRQRKAHMVHDRFAACTGERKATIVWMDDETTLRVFFFVLSKNCAPFVHVKRGGERNMRGSLPQGGRREGEKEKGTREACCERPR